MRHNKDVIVPNVWRPLPDWLGGEQPCMFTLLTFLISRRLEFVARIRDRTATRSRTR